MAKLKRTAGQPRISGKSGDKIFKWYGDKCVVQDLPTYPKKRKVTKRLKITWGSFSAASEYAVRVQADPEAFAAYKPHARKRGLSVRSFAMSDYMKQPRTSFIRPHLTYDGRAGTLVFINTPDLFKVISVHVVVTDAAGQVIEEGPATRYRKIFTYPLQRDHPPGQPVTIVATARDRPGHCVVVTVKGLIPPDTPANPAPPAPPPVAAA